MNQSPAVTLAIAKKPGSNAIDVAVVERSEVTGVYVLDSHGQATLRYVRPGHRFGDKLEILAGLAAGERIALDPIERRRHLDSQSPGRAVPSIPRAVGTDPKCADRSLPLLRYALWLP